MQRLSSDSSVDELSDTDLLQAYGREGNEAAFEALAKRHVDMIFSVSLRRSGNRQLAEEATQNVLISLSRKARRLSVQESNLSGWLHKGTRFEIAKLQRRETRIKIREQAYARDRINAHADGEDENFQRLYPLLDEAIDHLRPPDREVIVRRYLEGQNFQKIGEALGISEDAAQKRTSRAFDRLNQFFRRRAGVTVTATGLAAGISQHCVEAAPAACLQFAGKAASAGLVSVFTNVTLTTMNISKITSIAAGVAVLGGGTVYLATRDDTPAVIKSTPSEVASNASPPSAAGLRVPAGLTDRSVGVRVGDPEESGKADSANEELAKLESTSPHPGKEEFARRLSIKHDRLLKDLIGELGLNVAEAASLKAVLDERLETFGMTLGTGPGPGDSPEESLRKEMDMLAKAGGIIRGAGLRDDLEGIFSEEKLDAFDEREGNVWQTQLESLAYRELAKITPVIALSEDQKDRAFKLLQTSLAEKLREDQDIRAFLALQKNQAPAQMDLTDMAEAKFFAETFDGPDALAPDSPAFKTRIAEVVGGQILKKVEILSPVLDEGQAQRYRDYLIQTSMLPQLGIELPSPE